MDLVLSPAQRRIGDPVICRRWKYDAERIHVTGAKQLT